MRHICGIGAKASHAFGNKFLIGHKKSLVRSKWCCDIVGEMKSRVLGARRYSQESKAVQLVYRSGEYARGSRAG